MYIILSGTTDYYPQLLEFLSKEVKGFSLFEGKGGWEGRNLSAQMILLFNFRDARRTKEFLTDECNQKEVNIWRLEAEVI